MMTIQEDIDALDRMIESDAQKDKIRSQIRLVAREVAALEEDYARLAQTHAVLNEAHAKEMAEITAKHLNLEKEHSELKDMQMQKNTDTFTQKAAAIRKALTPNRIDHE